MSEDKKYTLYVHGMHCKACVVLTETELVEHPLVSMAKTSMSSQTVEVTGEFGVKTLSEIASELTTVLSQHKLSIVPEEKKVNWKEFIIAVPVALGFIVLFILLQKLGIVNLVNASKVTYGTAFLVGLVASVSTCMAVVGGLVLSLSATFAKEGDRVRPQLLFHSGRLISFFILGGVIGAAGSLFQLGSLGTLVLGLVIASSMFILGVQLLDVFSGTKRWQVAMPAVFSKRAFSLVKFNHTLTPALVGIATFFLPCGFTQSMQVYTLSTGSFLKGGLTMLTFALGTLPVLGLVSFSSFSIGNSAKSGIFFKSAGLIVIMFALFNLINSLVAIGWIAPVFNF